MDLNCIAVMTLRCVTHFNDEITLRHLLNKI